MIFAKKRWVLVVIVMISVVIFSVSACSPVETETPSDAETVEVGEADEEIVDEVVEPTELPAEEDLPEEEESLEAEPEPEEPLEDAERGPYLDVINITTEPPTAAVIDGMVEGRIDFYGYTFKSPELYDVVLDSPELKHSMSMAGYTELLFNPAGPDLRDGSFNPFVVPAVREAMNSLIDRNYIVDDLLGGLALPKYTILSSFSPDYKNLKDTVEELEDKYAYDLEVADERISSEMADLGAEKVDNLWTVDGQPVELIFMIRENSSHEAVSEYIATQLETIGFQVRREYVDGSTAIQMWMQGDPFDGGWHLYVTSWMSTAISRDQGDDFSFFYSPSSAYGETALWQNFKISDRFETLSQALESYDFNSFEERSQMFREALALSLENSSHVWLFDETSFSPYSGSVSVVPGVSQGILGSSLWPHTLRFTDQVGGEMNIAVPGFSNDPWNPISGTTWSFDANLRIATEDDGIISDPNTGLMKPQRIERAEILAEEGLPIRVTDDWVNLEFAPEIRIPDDAWAGWDAGNEVFISSAEMAGDLGEPYLTAKIKSTVVYPDDLFTTIRWHDGSQLSMADFVTHMILIYDRTNEESPIFDEFMVASKEIVHGIKAFRIVSEAPLTLEYYTDTYQLDAENNVHTFWPQYDSGEGAWHAVAAGILAELNGVAAFSRDKSTALGVEWLGYTHGPSLDILDQMVDQAIQETFIPYEATLKDYISEEEANARYTAFSDWYENTGHFWVGTGPFILSEVNVEDSMMTLIRNENYSDVMGKWDYLGVSGNE